ncbi:methylated-DNA--[protein]-cysteine S-methyltransferase [Streptomyces sp. SKN60]|uniref:methylated-DNA--[protein]-cysteine S-methyltransferase n=1 Tax=Streptomyces sp. SKN60 TaxID=2855506 RepID=UPI0022459484|nr:methylated-DNA--[protein]-cysteine S-methyltransferase [Streptomyces sp. SKN60]MCX2181061.1 methylated-DNA--[protein]-cysteine S-methyltransferase [Streptomyces sp. SKN60]
MNSTLYTWADGPLGTMLLVGRVAEGGRVALRSVSLEGQKGAVEVREGWVHEPAGFGEVAGQLDAYFAGRRDGFDLVFEEAGTEFQRKVWRALEEIPYGTTVSYGEIARRVGAEGAGVRAVGTAIGRNPLLVVRPCHRVIGADGSLRGYAAGLERKERLLALEGALGPALESESGG